jgi:hypothetical protein
VPGVPKEGGTVVVGEALAARVEVGRVVTVGLGMGVIDGVSWIAWVTCAQTVAAASVRTVLRSGVGGLVGVAELQAAAHSSEDRTPMRMRCFIIFVIKFFSFVNAGVNAARLERFPKLILR